MTKRRVIAVWLLLGLLSTPDALAVTNAGDVTITGEEIASASVDLQCLAYTPVGVCVWVTCTPFGCEVDWSVKVRHFTPDAVVTAYPTTGASPWVDTRAYASPNGRAGGGGHNTEADRVSRSSSLRFHNADVIGSPGSLWVDALAQSDYACAPGTTPYRPYFLSVLDPTWRSPLLETPWTLRYVNRGLRSDNARHGWGALYPRGGFLHQGHDVKAAAVIAQRAADLVTRERQPHIAWPMLVDDEPGYWPPGAVDERDAMTHQWQPLLPEPQSCVRFTDDALNGDGVDDPLASWLNEAAGYAFNLWRPYRCCERKGAVLVFHSGE